MSDHQALANAIEDAGIERSRAERVASVIFDAIHDSVATKEDVQASAATLQADIAAVQTELKSDVAALRSLLASEIGRLDTRIERLDGKLKPLGDQIMLRLGTLMVVPTGVFIAALRYFPPHA